MNYASWGLTGTSHSSQSKGVMEEVMRSGNIPIAGKMGVVGGGGVVPPALLDESRVPKFYLDALTACGVTNSNMIPHTALVYNLMVTSGLPRPVLSYIWSAVNRSLPGQLTRSEFFSCLALIALAQRGESLVALSEMQQLPIPHLQIPNSSVSSQTASPSKSRFIPSAFIPSSLLPRWSEKQSTSNSNTASVKKTTEMLSGVFSSTANNSLPSTISAAQESVADSDGALKTSTISSGSHLNSDVSKTTDQMSTCSSISSTAQTNGLECFDGVRKNQIQTADARYLEYWVKALSAATAIIEEANQIFASHLDNSLLMEVADTERGRLYYDCLEKAASIIKRLLASGGSSLPPDVRLHAEKALEIWLRLSSFHVMVDNSENTIALWACDICGQGISNHNEVDYGGHKYHSECANLWVNCVAPIFPMIS